ncbi:unnamed protein product [Vitrella brassicaformis CCMP3155]|uniref:carbonic anhydrase n=2 Tax=Vitrella brassicaformis TaxID=1169539 RepID=A0A0G4GA35_VITBC|nr:unnamed protein product [Vitrella brassicaformis CCMP3155]|eukprot:CEM25722.1 unnamed protein product [Vitrella brassicaformis CCMP3155]
MRRKGTVTLCLFPLMALMLIDFFITPALSFSLPARTLSRLRDANRRRTLLQRTRRSLRPPDADADDGRPLMSDVDFEALENAAGSDVRRDGAMTRGERFRMTGLRGAGLGLLLANAMSGREEAVAGDWGYATQGNDWPGICNPARITLRQSPIMLNETIAINGPKQMNLKINYKKFGVPLLCNNNGHTIQVRPESQKFVDAGLGLGGVMVNGRDYVVRQFHFHAPAEHTYVWKQDAVPERRGLELHIVHQSAMGDLTVLGATFEPYPNGADPKKFPDAPGTFLKTLLGLKNFPSNTGMEVKLQPKEARRIALDKVIPKNAPAFHYLGSLTTPPCSEVVTWYVLRDPLFVPPWQIKTWIDFFTQDGSLGNWREEQNTELYIPPRGLLKTSTRNNQQLYRVQVEPLVTDKGLLKLA